MTESMRVPGVPVAEMAESSQFSRVPVTEIESSRVPRVPVAEMIESSRVAGVPEAEITESSRVPRALNFS